MNENVIKVLSLLLLTVVTFLIVWICFKITEWFVKRETIHLKNVVKHSKLGIFVATVVNLAYLGISAYVVKLVIEEEAVSRLDEALFFIGAAILVYSPFLFILLTFLFARITWDEKSIYTSYFWIKRTIPKDSVIKEACIVGARIAGIAYRTILIPTKNDKPLRIDPLMIGKQKFYNYIGVKDPEKISNQ